ncbi:TIGR04222 domain-containing membrane protein [Pigmentiphaga aceris]|uniref:TIGR04222 domain-containing membrane protein n=1 Tax=Pigmentiphaga aceris TaxID=1940612 RepID=A0A5C0AWJ2_9BURK|nr:TIGR04222 domain-containing membrane protein [Pigmentiphaga aceris]QEI06545.1 TIGR04222 domain-containing membrane protein [Pigmentiphaga aceris]
MTMLPMFFYWNDAVFLPAYAALLVVTVLGHRAWLRWRNRPQAPSATNPSPLTDPYAVAYLRGGAEEAVRTAVFALLYRGALTRIVKNNLQRAQHVDETALRSLEAQVLTRFDTPRSAEGLLWESSWIRQTVGDYARRLERAGLLNKRGLLERRVYTTLVILLLVVTIVRSFVSTQMGFTGFPLMIGATLIAWFFLRPFWRMQTPLGLRVLDQQKQAHQRWMNGANNVDDATWVAAAFGVAALSALAYPMAMYAMPMMRKPSSSNGGDGGSSTSGGDSSSSNGSGCSSDSGSSDGGSCGDGGGGGSSD